MMTCTATYTPTAADTVSSYTESAAFSGDSNYTESNSTQSNNFSITQASSSTSVMSSQNPSVDGQQVTFTATIDGQYGLTKSRTGLRGNNKLFAKNGRARPQDIGGTVTWSANTGCMPTTVSGDPGTAQCVTSTLPQGTDTITASYSGDPNHSGSMGTLSGGQVVNTATVTVIASPASLNFGSRGIGGSHTMLVAVENVSAAKVKIGSASITSTGGDPNAFSFYEYCEPRTLKAGGKCYIGVTFRPHTTGLSTAMLNVPYDAAGSPLEVPLMGTGVEKK